ncbi:MAG: type I 3-dehydroquinate dehydratase [Thermoplasmata archaeon]|nr:type I 3-dehydroquinate dehydratase [Thermoplasmata archaeon]
MSALPRLVVSLPGRTLDETRRHIALAASAGADAAEVRLDRWPAMERERLRELFPAQLPLLATFRSRAEGGEGPDDPTERGETLERLFGLPFELVDVELARDRVPVARTGGPEALGSRHLPDSISVGEIGHLVESRPEGCRRLKLVLASTVDRFLSDLLPNLPRWVGPDTAVFTTGASGPLTRVWARELGEPWVFSCLPLGEESAPPVETSQVPVDQLRRSWSAAPGRRFAIVGAPVGHSLSPAVHAVWLAAEGRAASYVPVELRDKSTFAAMVSLGRRGWWDGWSVTHPWKEAAAQLADERTEASRATGVANTLMFHNGRVRADETDVGAIARRAKELEAERRWDGEEVVVVGTGGAARAAVFALAPSRRRVWVLGRRATSARELVAALGGVVATARDAHPTELVVHATTIGRGPRRDLDVPLAGWIGPGTTVLDFVYAQDDHQVRDLCRRSGAEYEDGRRLLVYQAAGAHRIWWGTAPSPSAIDAALRRVGCAA